MFSLALRLVVCQKMEVVRGGSIFSDAIFCSLLFLHALSDKPFKRQNVQLEYFYLNFSSCSYYRLWKRTISAAVWQQVPHKSMDGMLRNHSETKEFRLLEEKNKNPSLWWLYRLPVHSFQHTYTFFIKTQEDLCWSQQCAFGGTQTKGSACLQVRAALTKHSTDAYYRWSAVRKEKSEETKFLKSLLWLHISHYTRTKNIKVFSRISSCSQC